MCAQVQDNVQQRTLLVDRTPSPIHPVDIHMQNVTTGASLSETRHLKQWKKVNVLRRCGETFWGTHQLYTGLLLASGAHLVGGWRWSSSVGMMKYIPNCSLKVIQNSMVPVTTNQVMFKSFQTTPEVTPSGFAMGEDIGGWATNLCWNIS